MKEKQKQLLSEIMQEEEKSGLYDETIEQAAKKYANKKGDIPTTKLEDAIFKQGFIDGAKWQQEQNKKLYSEEDMHKLMYEYQEWLVLTLEPVKPFEEWFEQFKKK